MIVAWSLFGATYATLACRPAGVPIRAEVVAASARAWVVDPALMFPWTTGVLALIVFLIGALAARPLDPRRLLVVLGVVWCIAFASALFLGLAATNCR